MQKIKALLLVVAVVFLAGCATNRSVLDVSSSVPQDTQVVADADGKAVFINAVRDNRSFQEKPRSPNIPSLDPSEASSDVIKSRAIGRKRNSYGKGLGDILLKEGTTVESLVISAIRRAFSENGYRVLDDSSQITADVYVVDADIEQFWTWMNPGFWAITLSSEISTNVSIKEGKKKHELVVQSKAAEGFQVGTESNYLKVITGALNLYVEELKRKLKNTPNL